MKKTIFILALLLFSLSLYSQCYPVFKIMDKQPQYYSGEAMDRNFPYFYRFTNLYYKNSDSSALLFGYYDGNDWKKIGPHVMKGYSLRLLKWGSRILGYGRVTQINGLKAPAHRYFGVMEYKAGKWDSIPGCSFDSAVNIEACSNADALYLRVYQNGTPGSGSVYQYDSTGMGFVKILDYMTNNYVKTRMQAGTHRILLSNVNKINGVTTRGFAYFENDSVKLNYASGFEDYFDYAIDKANDHVYAMYLKSNPEVFEFGSSALPSRKTRLSIGSAFNPLHVQNGQLIWMSYRGNSSDRTYNILCPGDTTWKQIYNLSNSGISMTNPYAAVNGIFCYMNIDGVSKSIKLDNGALLEGIAFIDNDSNCIPDSGEHRLRNYTVYGKSSKFYASSATDDSGRYSLYVIADTIKVYGSGNLPPCAGKNAILTQTGNSFLKNIPIMDPHGYDVKLKLISPVRTRWNSTDLFGAIIENNGYPVGSVDVNILLDPKINVANADSNFYSINANNASGRLYNLDYFEKRWVYINAWIDTNTTKPDTIICHKAFAGIDSVEFDYQNNRDSACQLVVYSFDPNHKECSQKTAAPGVSTKLDYYVEFQNEGNDDAHDVVVVDAFSSKLDPATLQIQSASHPYTVDFKEGQLIFTFKNIYLKPMKLDEARSKGYIRFSINTVKGLSKGDSIQNNAYIYFDLNAPVITNMSVVKIDYSTSVNTIVHSSGSNLLIYPNPAYNIVNVNTNLNAPIQVYNTMGELIYQINPINGNAELDISALPNGMYIIRCGGLSGKFIKQE